MSGGVENWGDQGDLCRLLWFEHVGKETPHGRAVQSQYERRKLANSFQLPYGQVDTSYTYAIVFLKKLAGLSETRFRKQRVRGSRGLLTFDRQSASHPLNRHHFHLKSE